MVRGNSSNTWAGELSSGRGFACSWLKGTPKVEPMPANPALSPCLGKRSTNRHVAITYLSHRHLHDSNFAAPIKSYMHISPCYLPRAPVPRRLICLIWTVSDSTSSCSVRELAHGMNFVLFLLFEDDHATQSKTSTYVRIRCIHIR